MSLHLLRYFVCTGIVTIVLTLLNDVECCSMNTYDIISFMSRNPNFRNDPCYIQWQAAQNAKLTEIWTQREKLEESIRESDRRQREYDARQRENRQRSYQSTSSTSSSTPKKHTGIWKVIDLFVGVTIFIMIAVCCCAAQSDSDDAQTLTATNLIRNENPTERPHLASVVAGNQTAPYAPYGTPYVPNTITADNSHPRQETSVPLMPRRQDSLPSYDDATKMPSAPPIERATP